MGGRRGSGSGGLPPPGGTGGDSQGHAGRGCLSPGGPTACPPASPPEVRRVRAPAAARAGESRGVPPPPSGWECAVRFAEGGIFLPRRPCALQCVQLKVHITKREKRERGKEGGERRRKRQQEDLYWRENKEHLVFSEFTEQNRADAAGPVLCVFEKNRECEIGSLRPATDRWVLRAEARGGGGGGGAPHRSPPGPRGSGESAVLGSANIPTKGLGIRTLESLLSQ